MKKTTVKYESPSFLSLLCLLFIGLKLGGIITWSWWWVLSPIWLPMAIVISGALMVVIVTSIFSK